MKLIKESNNRYQRIIFKNFIFLSLRVLEIFISDYIFHFQFYEGNQNEVMLDYL